MSRGEGMADAPRKRYNAETIFPWRLLDELVTVLRGRDAHFITYSELRLRRRFPRALRTLDYVAEYLLASTSSDAGWFERSLSASRALLRRWGPSFVRARLHNDADPITVLLQHDADRQPYKTEDFLRRERMLGVRSSAYFFRDRHAWDDDREPYELDVAALQEFERAGFEIGYHLNAPELVGYDPDRAMQRIAEDVRWFSAHFHLRSFVPHGGRPSPSGENNDHTPYRGALEPLWWVYNGRGRYGVVKDHTWSDGLVYQRPLADPRVVAQQATGGSRLLFLMHPQYYGDALMPDWERLPIAGEPWWRELWDLS